MDTRAKAIIRTLTISLVGGVSVCALKIGYGRSTESLAFIADGIHSLFDAAATLIGIVSIVFSSKPPDESHPYGHRKLEAVSAVMLSLLLFVAAYEVGTMALERLHSAAAFPSFSAWGFVVLGVAMMISLSVARIERLRADKLSSPFLASDALHNQSDFLISIAVLASIISTRFHIPYVDAGASILIAVYLVYFSIRLTLFNLRPLMDHSVLDPKEVEGIVTSIDGVMYCHHIRSRGETGHHFLDLNIHLPGQITLERAHQITHNVEERLKAAFPGLVDVVIHTEPHDHEPCSKD